MNHDLVLDILEPALEAARLVLDEHGGESEILVDDLRGLIGALYLALRHYRGAIAHVNESDWD